MRLTIDIPVVSTCSITGCSYNADSLCHAKAITIGDGDTPHCDTLFRGEEKVNGRSNQAGVGACKVSGCAYNDDLECTADEIKVGLESNSVRCTTFSVR